MSNALPPPNRVAPLRRRQGWSQAELARRAGISRTAVSAVEIGRLTPSVTAALALAQALQCSVEELFRPGSDQESEEAWAWPAERSPCRYWKARVEGRILRYPVEPTAAGEVAHDGVVRDDQLTESPAGEPERTLVIASCDPAAGLLAEQYLRRTGFRLLVLPRSSQQALRLLGQGLVHAAGLHLSQAGEPGGNSTAVRDRLGSGYQLVRMADWQEVLAIRPSAQVRSVSSALRTRLSWVGREKGSGARICLDELLQGQKAPRRMARDHRGVAEAIRSGWADAGVCLRLASEEANLDSLPLRWESYDLCFPDRLEADPRLRALITLVREPEFRRLLGGLPGYDVASTGETGAA